VAASDLVAAGGEIMLHTRISHAEEIFILGLGNKTTRASVSAAMAFRSTAQLIICVLAIHVIAMYGVSIGPMNVAYRTFV
jgi:hypothetical protein